MIENFTKVLASNDKWEKIDYMDLMDKSIKFVDYLEKLCKNNKNLFKQEGR